MLTFGRPLVFLLGGAFALVPLVLHFLARRPPDRAPLPTARFLSQETTSRVRLERRPTDLARLAMRVLFVLLLASAFAAPSWSAPGGGTGVVVLLDGSGAMSAVWSEAIDSVRKHLGEANGAPAKLIVFTGDARELGVSPGVLDSLAAAPPAGAKVSRAPSSPPPVDRSSRDPSRSALPADPAEPGRHAEADLRVALTKLHEAGASIDADSVRAWIVFASRRGAWAPGMAGTRARAWQGEIGVDALVGPAFAAQDVTQDSVGSGAASSRAATAAPAQASRAVVVSAATPADSLALSLALAELARRMHTVDSAPLLVAFAPLPNPSDVTETLTEGGIILLGPTSRTGVEEIDALLPSTDAEGALPAHPLIRFIDGWEMHGARFGGRLPTANVPSSATEGSGSGSAAASGELMGSRVLAATGDGEPAIVATRVRNACVVTAAFDVAALLADQAGAVPEVLARMLGGCDVGAPRADADLPLDRGALALLRGSEAGPPLGADDSAPPGAPDSGPSAVAVRDLHASTGDPGTIRLLLLLALTLAAVEGYLSYARANRAPSPSA